MQEASPLSTEEAPSGRRRGLRILRDLKIGPKLSLSFGLLLSLALLVAGLSYLGSRPALNSIERTESLRVPTTIASTTAKDNLLKMLVSLLGYTAWEQPQFIEEFRSSERFFRDNLAELERLAPDMDAVNRTRVEEIRATFTTWEQLPPELFELRDDQLECEVCQRLRQMHPPHQLPVMIVTAKDQVTDLVTGFSVGANDYLRKPFSSDELLARLQTHLRLTKINQASERFVPAEFLEFLQKESIVNIQLGEHVSKEMTVMFSDIRSFTALGKDDPTGEL